MTPDQQRIKIAEWEGWYHAPEKNPDFPWFHPDSVAAHDPRPPTGRYGQAEPPNYAESISARKAVWGLMRPGERERFQGEVFLATIRHHCSCEEARLDHWPECVLRALELWEEPAPSKAFPPSPNPPDPDSESEA